MIRFLLYFALCVSFCSAAIELLQNPDFEDDFDGNWFCNGCFLDHSFDAYTGFFSADVSLRTASWAGLAQYVPLQPNKKYYFRAMAKILNQVSGHIYHKVEVKASITLNSGNVEYPIVCRHPHVETAHGWQVFGGDFETGPEDIQEARIYFQAPEPDVEFIVDSATLYEIEENPNWLSEANARIEQIRKTDITFAVNISSAYNPADISLEVALQRHAFAFGTAVKADYISGNDETSMKYQDFFYSNFEYAVLENALKWRVMEWNEGNINYDRPRNAIDALEMRGIPVRGHCVFWEVEKNCPNWLISKTAEEVRSNIARRAQYVVSAFKGRLTHWDVNNEELHGSFFKDKLQDTSIMADMFQQVHSHDPNVTLFLNEYNIVNAGHFTHAYLSQALRLKAAGVPVGGIGAQSHLKEFPDPKVIQKRLDVIAEAGLPIWISELDYPDVDMTSRANGYETVLRLYYSNPNIDGVLLWGFWNQAMANPDGALVDGEYFVINEAGLRWQQLIQQEWNTTATLQPSASIEQLQLRGFQGLYNVNVKHLGQTIKMISYDVPNKAATYTVTVNL